MSKIITEMKVRGLKVLINNVYHIIIIDSYKIMSKEKMNIILDGIFKKKNCYFITNRTKESLINQ